MNHSEKMLRKALAEFKQAADDFLTLSPDCKTPEEKQAFDEAWQRRQDALEPVAIYAAFLLEDLDPANNKQAQQP